MGLFDRARRLFGLAEGAPPDPTDSGPQNSSERAIKEKKGRARFENRPDRPRLGDVPDLPTETLEDALAAREANDLALANRIFATIDRGRGLRTVLRAAMAMEQADESLLAELLPKVGGDEPRWKLSIQIAAALGEPALAAPWLRRAESDGAPSYALAFAHAVSTSRDARRAGLVELLFEDAVLARSVAARDLNIEGTVFDQTAVQRYTSLSHGRDMIRRFGPEAVARIVEQALQRSGAS